MAPPPSNPENALLEEIHRQASRHPSGISFEDFMTLALYHPSYGYYSRPRPIGKKGDFFTSVSTGPCFGELLSLQIRQIHQLLGSPQPFSLIEQGAHSGQLTRDILQTWPDLPCIIVEPVPALRHLQQGLFQDVSNPPRHASNLADLLEPHAVFLCNELLDSFPVRRLQFTLGRWHEWRVCSRGASLSLRLFPVEETNFTPPSWIPSTAPEGFNLEVCPALLSWLRDLSSAFHQGVALIIDYGLTREERFAPERHQGTLRAYRQHRLIDNPLERPGETDLTSHVDFTSLIEAAPSFGWEILGFTDQSRFLTGIAVPWLRSLEGTPDNPQMAQFKTLTHPGMMGRSFRVLALAKNTGPLPLDGCQFQSPLP